MDSRFIRRLVCEFADVSETGYVDEWCYFAPGQQYKISLRDARVRYRDAWLVNGQAAEHQEVEIEHPRTPVPAIAVTPLPFFDPLKRCQEVPGREGRQQDGDGIDEIGLFDAPEWRRTIE